MAKSGAYPSSAGRDHALASGPESTRWLTAEKPAATSGGGWKTFQNTASRPPGRNACAALDAPATASIQCQAWPATTASKVRPALSHSSNGATSTSSPNCRASSAMRASTSTPITRQPAAWNCRAAMPVPHPTSRKSVPGLPATIRSTICWG